MPMTTLVSYSVERVEVMDVEGNVDQALMPDLSGEQIAQLYWYMVLTRTFDDRMLKLQRQGRLGTFARVMGQEGAHIPAAFALRADDWMVPAFREAGAFLRARHEDGALPAVLERRRAGQRLPRRESTCCRRRSRWARTCCTRSASAGRSGTTATQAAVLTSFGEGATSEGDFSEAMNFAAVFKSPVVFFCQNNQWAISVPYTRQTPGVHRGPEGDRLRHARRPGRRQRRVRRVPRGERGARPRPRRRRPDAHRGAHLPGDRPHHLRRRHPLPGRAGGRGVARSATPSCGWPAT